MSGMIERLEEALERATPEKWTWVERDAEEHHKGWTRIGRVGGLDESAQVYRRHDAELIVAAVNALPSLLKLVRAAQGLDAALAEQHSRFDSDGVYERYWICPPEEEALVAALAEVEGKP